ncbi:hypothetical protein P43SY_008852 [Pythium insidiosum]|uniref:Uncharacterized protein n=1 Tax=Pythium insidiosum TaxID=114742 RepID=A0AAD5QBN0_PYTIN|nr:hypothetical protein P43SY_008852 [Pythium insidiosum]KAJ0410948.1 hypothetical protein ATCC90586_004301 [Pythium insidiosum]
MARPRVTVASVFLSGVTGMTLAGVSLLAYLRFQHPQQFAETTARMSHPELGDETTRKWGLYGTGLADAIPQPVKDLFYFDNLPERFAAQKAKREAQIRKSLEDLRPKDA